MLRLWPSQLPLGPTPGESSSTRMAPEPGSGDATPITTRVTHLYFCHGLHHHPENSRGYLHLARNKDDLCHGKAIRVVSIVDAWIAELASMLHQEIHRHRCCSPARYMPRQTGSGAQVMAIGPRQMHSTLQPTRLLLC